MKSVTSLDKKTVMMDSKLASEAQWDLNVSELCVFMCALGDLPQTVEGVDHRSTWMRVSIDSFAKARGCTFPAARQALKEASESLFERTFTTIEGETGRTVTHRWIKSIKKLSAPTDKEVQFQWNDSVLPFITELKKYISIKLIAVGQLDHKMSFKLLFLCKANRVHKTKKSGSFKVTMEFFLHYCGLSGSSYEEYAILNNRLLKPAIEELKKCKLLEIEITKPRGLRELTFIWRSLE